MTAVKVWSGGAWVESTTTEKVWVSGAWVEFSPDPGDAISVFTTEVPVSLDALDPGEVYTLGTRMYSSVPGTVTHVRWPFPISSQPTADAVRANVFRVSDEAKVGGADASFAMPGTPSSPGAPAWNVVALTTPAHFDALEVFCPAIWTPGRYVVTSGFLGTDYTVGPLTIPANGGRFNATATTDLLFPADSFGQACYFPDVRFVPD